MRRFCGGLVAKRTRGRIVPGAALVDAGLVAVAAAPAGATIRATSDPETARAAVVGPGIATLVQSPFLTVPPQGTPVGVGDALSGLTPFPRDGSSYFVLSTGDATRADQPDQPGTFPSFDDAGRVAVTSAADTGARMTPTADFYDGIFQVKQATPKKKPKKATALITDLVLKGEPPRSECAPLKGSASAAAAKKKKRGAKSVLGSLWGNGKGKFRTNGKYSSATVRGTIWLTQDRCDGTLTTVRRGTVSVRDLKRRRTVTVKAGHSYLARAASRAKGATK
jgi:hypothetical protein